MSKVTIATVKSFIRKNQNNLHILCKSRFDGMTDGCEATGQKEFLPAKTTEEHKDHTLGVAGAWFVGQSRDSFTEFNNGEFKGFRVYNACGSFVLAAKAA